MLWAENYISASDEGVYSFKPTFSSNIPPINVQEIIDRGNEITMYFVVRNDLGMSPGKIAAQVGHGTELALEIGKRRAPHWTPEDRPCAKVVLQADYSQFHKFISDVTLSEDHSNHLAIVVDEGRTEISPNTMTVAALIPMPRREAQQFTGKLKRYK